MDIKVFQCRFTALLLEPARARIRYNLINYARTDTKTYFNSLVFCALAFLEYCILTL